MNSHPQIVVIGASSGGIDALGKILSSLPANYGLPIVIVMHLKEGHQSLLPDIFKHRVKLNVQNANVDEKIKAGTIYFASPGHHLKITENKTFSFGHEPPIFFSRPSIDVLFKSASDAYAKNLVGILLTGANQDGALGLKAIQDAGGMTVVQNPISAEMATMPAAGMAYASPECLLSLDKIAELLSTINPNLQELEESESEVEEATQEKYEILIVDDVKDNLLALNALLRRDNIEIHQALSGEEALELMMKHDFCLALLDVRMPIMNGFELAELMRGTNKTRNVPIIFVTADTKDQTHTFKGYESGAVDFLRKPLDPHSVQSKVKVFLELHKQKLELNKQVEELKIVRDEQAKLLLQLNKTKIELESAVKSREDFMSIAGHELKTPITSLKLHAQLRKRNLKKGNESLFTSEKLEKMFDSDNKQFERLTRLVDDMLDISRISAGNISIELTKFDLTSLLQDVVERNLELFNMQDIPITTNPCGPIHGTWDRFRIEQVITNLLTNSIRYGGGNPVHISLIAHNNNAIIAIKDHGIGIIEKDFERIFQKFERALGTEKVVGGLGLGLYIVKQIIEAHKGTIKVESIPGDGSTFTVTLPLIIT